MDYTEIMIISFNEDVVEANQNKVNWLKDRYEDIEEPFL